MEPEGDGLSAGHSLQEYLAILRRRMAVILQAFVLISAVGVVLALLAKPVYQASAKLLVEGPSYNMNTVDSSNPLSSLFQISQQQTVDTQVEVLQAEPLLEQAAALAGPASLAVSNVKDTNVIEVTAESGSARTAADAPNTLLKLFIAQDTNQDLAEMEQARRFISKQGALTHRKLVDSEAALKDFKEKKHLPELVKNRDEQIAAVGALSGEYQSATAGLAALRAQMDVEHALLAQEPATTVTHTQATNGVIAGLEAEIRAAEVQRVGLTQPGGLAAGAPQVRALDAQIAALRQKIAAQPHLASSQTSAPNPQHYAVQAKIEELEAQVPVLQTQASIARRRLAQAQKQVGSYAGLELTLDRLNREHDTALASDKSFSDQLADLTLREKAHHATARIIETAQVPTAPIRPKRMQSIIFACLIGLFVGACLALLQEFLDDRINSVEEANRVLGLPSLGHVPALSAEDAKLLPQMRGLDPASESYRVLRTNIHFASVDAPARTLLVTSSNPGEGKTTTAANLAFAMAMDGRRVILVDTDLRRPALHKLLDLPALPGLTDVLLGHAALAPHEVMPGLSVLTAGSTAPNPGELINSRTFRNLVDGLTQRADVVIFDSPPVLVAADAAILASQMDGTIVVVEVGSTKKAAAQRVLQLLRQARANVLGLAFNKLRARDSGEYQYYQYQYVNPAMDKVSAAPPRTLLPTSMDPELRPLGHGEAENDPTEGDKP